MLTYELNRTHLGQGMDIDWHNRRRSEVSESEYLEMCACKTGCLARITARLAAIVTDQPEPVERAVATYAERMSVGFQIIDDVLDLEHSLGEAGEFGKAFGNDIREGKTTLMVIHALSEAVPDRAERLQSVLADPDPSDEAVLDAIEIIQETGAVEYSRERAMALAADARAAIDPLDLAPEPAETLDEFPGFMIERQH
jgi:geranylgeranyl diphosphate synthase type I